MTYEYTVAPRSAVYHIIKPGRMYPLCGAWIGQPAIHATPPVGKKPCAKCAKVRDEQSVPPVPEAHS